MSANSWLITGGAGFIGSNLLRLVATSRPDQNIVVLDDLTYAGDIARIEDVLSSKIQFVKGSICDETLVSKLFQDHDFSYVLHLAAESHVDRSLQGPVVFERTNVGGTLNLLEAARKNWHGNVSNRRFLHVSTDEVYGDLEPNDPPFTENTPYRPSSPYSASKAASDHFVRAWGRSFGLPVLLTNCSNNYGPWQHPEKLIPLMISNLFEQKPLPMYGDGMQRRDWIHVEDHCRGILTVLEKGRVGETYLIGAENEQPNREIIETLTEAVDAFLGRKPGTSRNLIQSVKDRPGHDRRYAIDASKIRGELGWNPRHDFKKSLVDLVRWTHENRKWVDRVKSGDYLEYYRRQYEQK